MKTLHLSLKKEWYEMIESGVKTEEYREIKPYWTRRFIGMNQPYFLFAMDINKQMSKVTPTSSSHTVTPSEQ